MNNASNYDYPVMDILDSNYYQLLSPYPNIALFLVIKTFKSQFLKHYTATTI